MQLRIANLSKTYPNGVRALHDVSLTIGAGMFGLVGPNGAGKSTLMRTIATLQEVDTGTIDLDGLDVLKNKDAVRRLLGYLPQEFGLYPKLTAWDMLDHFAVLKGVADRSARKDLVAALFQQTNLYEVRKKKLGTFSGGMKQRFGIALALVGNPKLLIVDEPTAGLDPAERHRFLNLLGGIGQQIVVILSTHIIDDVQDLCPRMAIVDKGQVLFEGAPQEAVDRLAGSVWRKPVDMADVAACEQRFRVISRRLIAGRTHVRVHSPRPPEAGFVPVDPTVEDAYFLHLLRPDAANAPAPVAPVRG